MNKQRKTSHILNVFQYDADGHVVLPASLALGIAPTGEDNSGKVPTTAWVRSIVGGAVTAYSPTSRTITINGTSYDLSANRAWSIDTGVLTASAGSGISVSVVNQNLNIVNTGLLTATSGSGISVSTVNQNLNIVNTGLLTATAGAGISVSTVSQNLNIVNTGLLTATAGSGITVSVVNQNLNVVNTGILTASAGSGISLTVVGQNLNVVNTGVLTASAGAGISLSIVGGNLNVVNTITNNNQLTNGAGYITSSALTGYATETYVGTQISNLVDAAPGTLDTLNELAAALGDDPNFATTVSTSIGTKVPQARTITINGTSYDLTANRSWTINSMVYPSAGIALSTGTAWGTSITDNSANWNTAFGWGNHASAGYLTSATAATTYVSLTGSYANPSWITSLAYSKITGVPAFLTSYTETDTLASVTGRGATTTSPITINGGGSQPLTLTTASGSPWHLALVRNDLGLTSRVFAHNSPYNGWYFEHNISIGGSTNWHSGNLTNLNQLSNGPGYITGYTETDTLNSVTSRGNTIDTKSIRFTNASGQGVRWDHSSWTNNAFIRMDNNFDLRIGGHNSISFITNHLNVGDVVRMSIDMGGTVSVAGSLNFADSTNGISKSGARLTIRSESTDNVANFADYGMYLPRTGQIAGLYVESPIEARTGLRMGSGAGNGTITVGADTGAVANRLVQRDGNGYAFFNYINSNVSESENPTINSFFTSNGDGYLRKSNIAHVRSQLGNYGSWITSSSSITGAAGRLSTRDIRTIAPNSENAAELRFGFTSYNNNNTSPWADYLHLRSYSDSSGGNDNLVMFNKNGIGMRIWQQTFGSGTAYSSYVDVLHSSNYSSYALPISGGTLSGPLQIGTSVYTTSWNDGGGSYIEVTGNSTATRKLRIQSFNGSSAYAQWFMDGGNMQIYGDVAGVRNILIDTTTTYIRHNGSNKFWGGSDGTRTQGWSYYQENSAGMHWPNNGWHLMPSNSSDFRIHSGNTTDVSLRLETSGTTRGYVYAENDNSIGFLTNSRSWAFRTYSNGNALVYGYLTVNGAGSSSSIYMNDSDEGQREIHCNSNRIGFLNQSSSWGAWCDDSGNWITNAGMYASAFYDQNNSGYYIDLDSSTTSSVLNGTIRLNGGAFGTNSVSGSSQATLSRTFAPQGASNGFNGGAITAAIKIRLPFRGNDCMWSMKVRIYNYGNDAVSEYTIGNYSYAAGAYHRAAYFMGGVSAPPRTVRFGNDGTYDCVWIGETSTVWSYPQVSVMDFQGGYVRSSVQETANNWNVTFVTSFDTVADSITPSIRFSNVTAVDIYTGGLYASNVYASSDVRGNDVYTTGGWFRNHTNSNGIYWSTTGWHLYPKNGSDFYMRSGSSDASIQFMRGGTEANYIHNASDNAIGFLSTGRSWILRVDNSGNTTASGDVTAYSDKRLKSDITPINDALQKVLKLNGVSYKRIDLEDKSTKIGFIAQDVKEIVPEVVSVQADTLAGINDRHSIDYGKMVALLTEAIKEQQKQIEELQNKLDNVLSSR